jgi:hypothetical protein
MTTHGGTGDNPINIEYRVRSADNQRITGVYLVE